MFEVDVVKRGPLKGMNPVVTLGAAVVMVFTLLAGTLATETLASSLRAMRAAVTPFLAWYYVALVAFLLAFVIWLGMGRYKNIRLGGDDERPEFTTLPWLAMLFAATAGW